MRVFLFLASMMLMNGCVATGDLFDQVAEPGPKEGVAYFFRQSAGYGYASCPKLMIDGQRAGCLRNGGFIEVPFEPGQHEIWFTYHENRDKDLIVNIDIEPSKTYFYEYGTYMTDLSVIGPIMKMSGGESLAQMTKEYSIPILLKLKDSSD